MIHSRRFEHVPDHIFGRIVAGTLFIVAVLLFIVAMSGCASLDQRVASHTLAETRLIYTAALAADATSTAAASNNGYELNPIYQGYTGTQLAQRVAISGLIVYPVCDGLVRLLWPGNDNAIKGCYIGGSFLRFGTASWNTAYIVGNNKKPAPGEPNP